MKPEEFGLTEEDIKSVEDINPTLELSKLTPTSEPIKLKIVSTKPETVGYEDKKTKEHREELVLTVQDVHGIKKTLWLSATSLKREMFKIAEKYPDLKDVKILVSVREYDHPKFGTTRAYTVNECE